MTPTTTQLADILSTRISLVGSIKKALVKELAKGKKHIKELDTVLESLAIIKKATLATEASDHTRLQMILGDLIKSTDYLEDTAEQSQYLFEYTELPAEALYEYASCEESDILERLAKEAGW